MYSQIASKYKDRKFIAIFIIGFGCGIPLPLTSSMLSNYLFSYGIDVKTVGFFGLVGLPYTIKPLWSPLIDNITLPILNRFGKRKGWLILSQVVLVFLIILFAQLDPSKDLGLVAAIVTLIAFFSATQDIIVDALRIEMLKDEDQGFGVTSYVFGYRIALLFAAAGGLVIADQYSWKITLVMLAISIAIAAFLASLLNEEPIHEKVEYKNFTAWIKHAFLDPFTNFTQRPNWVLVILVVFLYRISDAYLGMMTSPFLLGLGFSYTEIAKVLKLYGFIMTLVGTFLGGLLVKRLSIYNAMLIAGVLSSLSNLVFILQYYFGHDVSVLIFVTSVENLTGSISGATLLAYLGLLCNRKFTATQYAMLTSLTAFNRTILTSTSGIVAKALGWVDFFIFSAIIALPSLLIILYLNKKEHQNEI